MVFDPSVYECPSVTSQISNDVIIPDESSDEDDDFYDRHFDTLAEIMEEDVFLNRLSVIDELEIVFAQLDLSPALRTIKLLNEPTD